MHNPTFVLENETHKLLWNFEIQTDHLFSVRRPDLVIINKTKRTCRIVDYVVPANHRIKLKESEKRDKYLDLARELKKNLWNMKVMGIFLVQSPNELVQRLKNLKIRERVETIQTTVLLRSTRILKRVLET